MKIFRNIYVKDYKKFPYQKLSGKHTLYYSGKIICGITEYPTDFDYKKDYYFDCDCNFGDWKNIQRVL